MPSGHGIHSTAKSFFYYTMLWLNENTEMHTITQKRYLLIMTKFFYASITTTSTSRTESVFCSKVGLFKQLTHRVL